MAEYEGISPVAAVLAVHSRHVSFLREALLRIRQDLERRSECHDRSKLRPEELPGFARINKAARREDHHRDCPYGSPEYKESLASEAGAVAHHYALNSHHPEFHESARKMGWLDLIEMVCDWNAAAKTYGNQDLRASIEVHRKRFNFTPEQWWLIEEVASFLEFYGA